MHVLALTRSTFADCSPLTTAAVVVIQCTEADVPRSCALCVHMHAASSQVHNVLNGCWAYQQVSKSFFVSYGPHKVLSCFHPHQPLQKPCSQEDLQVPGRQLLLAMLQELVCRESRWNRSSCCQHCVSGPSCSSPPHRQCRLVSLLQHIPRSYFHSGYRPRR